jgi:hypothetical protein
MSTGTNHGHISRPLILFRSLEGSARTGGDVGNMPARILSKAQRDRHGKHDPPANDESGDQAVESRCGRFWLPKIRGFQAERTDSGGRRCISNLLRAP